MPRTRLGQAAYRSVRTLRRPLGNSRNEDESRKFPGSSLFAFYDLAVAPVTFDFLWFLVAADLERRRRARASVHVVIVPGPLDGLRQEEPEYERIIDPSARQGRIDHILLPVCRFLPSLGGLTLLASRQAAEEIVANAADVVFPQRYEPRLPSYANSREPLRIAREQDVEIGVLRATEWDLHAAERWLTAQGCDRRIVTITLRGYGYMRARNSNVAAWAEFARRAERNGFFVILVPDTEQCLDGLPSDLGGLRVFREASVHVGLRMAIYERAYLNLGVNNGPMGLCWLNDRTRYITFKILTDGAPQTTSGYMRSLGFEIGSSLPFAKPWQKWVWADDDPETIEREFDAMVAILENERAAASV